MKEMVTLDNQVNFIQMHRSGVSIPKNCIFRYGDEIQYVITILFESLGIKLILKNLFAFSY